MIFPNRRDLGLVFYGGPLAIILIKKNLTQLMKINLMRDFFINEFGVYKIDPEMQYHHGKQAMFFYNSHEQKINTKTVKELYKLYYKKKHDIMLEKLQALYPEIKDKNTIFEMFEAIVKETDHYAIDIDTEKYLPEFTAHKPQGTKLLLEIPNKSMKELDNMYPPAIKPMPIILIMVVILVIAIVWQDLPDYASRIRDSITGFMR